MLVAVAGLAIVVTSVAISTRLNLMLEFLAMIGALSVLLASFRWPLLPLFAFAALIPIEEAVVIGGLGTLSRYAELAFIVAYGLPRLGRLTISAMPLPGWIYVGWAILSIGWALDANVTLQEIPVLGLLFAMAVLVASAVVDRPAIVRPILWAYSLSAATTAVIGVYGYVQGGASTDRVAALPGQDPAHYAALLLPALVFAAYELFHGRATVPAAVVATVCTVGIIVSGTRGAWLSAAVVAGLYLFPHLGPIRRFVAVMLATAFVIVALQLPGVEALVAERTDTALSSGGAGRTDIWWVGLLIYGSAPITGVGLDNFPVAYTPERIRESDVGILAPWRPANRAPHNIVIGTLGELGTVGLAVLAMFLLPLLLRTGWGPDAAAVQAALASLATMALFLDLLNRKQVWLIIGIACGLTYLARRSAIDATRSLDGRDGAPSTLAVDPAPGDMDGGAELPARHRARRTVRAPGIGR